MQHIATSTVAATISDIVSDLMSRRQMTQEVSPDQSLRELGLKSLDLVNMMMAVEDAFGIEIPQAQLTLENFRSIRAIERLVTAVTS